MGGPLTSLTNRTAWRVAFERREGVGVCESKEQNIERTGIRIVARTGLLSGSYFEAEAFREKGMPYRSVDGAAWVQRGGGRPSDKRLGELRDAFYGQVSGPVGVDPSEDGDEEEVVRAWMVWLSRETERDWHLSIGDVGEAGWPEVLGFDGSRTEFRTDRERATTCMLGTDLVQRLFDAAWNQGVRPAGWSGDKHGVLLMECADRKIGAGQLVYATAHPGAEGELASAREVIAEKDARIAELVGHVDGLMKHNASLVDLGQRILERDFDAGSKLGRVPLPDGALDPVEVSQTEDSLSHRPAPMSLKDGDGVPGDGDGKWGEA